MNPDSMEIPVWSFAYGSSAATGTIKNQPTDFIVEESLPFTPEGSGEHVFLYIEKTGENTEFVARALARLAGVRQRDIGFAGLKDRHAVTMQWFSVWLPGKETPDFSPVESENIRILQTTRHSRKLKRGALTGNHFRLVIRNFEGDRERCKRQLETIREQGFPNYFGEQRFGHQGKNIDTARALFAGTKKIKRQQRGIYFSAARAYLFNQILSRRIELDNWNRAIACDVMMLNDSNSHFKIETPDDELQARSLRCEIHPTGSLYGTGSSLLTGDALAIEEKVIASDPELATGLIDSKLERDCRALRVMAKELSWEFTQTGQLHLSFFLPSGSYATALLREIVTT